MGSADRSAPVNVPRPGVPRPGDTDQNASAPIRPSPILQPGGRSNPATKPSSPLAPPRELKGDSSFAQQLKNFGKQGPKAPAAEGGVHEPKLNPVPLPWKRPEAKKAPATDPAVLLVGADEVFLPAIEKGLARYNVFVETTGLNDVVGTVVAAAPDLVMLMGEAARDCGMPVLQKLAQTPQAAVVPVVILDDDTALDARLRAFRHGAAAVIPRSASVDAIADQVAKLAREIPERHGAALGEVGDTTLHEFVDTLARELRSGILTINSGSEDDPVRLVLGEGRPLADLISDFVARARKHVLAAEPLHYEFEEHVSGTVKMLDAAQMASDKSPDQLPEVRIALADSDAARADNIAQELRGLGASVVVTDLNPGEVRFARMRQVDPTILIIGEEHVQGEGYGLVRRMRRDTRLRWASLLVVRWDEIWSEAEAAPVTAVQRIAGTLAALAEPEANISARAQETHGFDTRLEVTGPARCLRALAAAGTSLRVTVNNPRLFVELDVANKLVVGATAKVADREDLLEGASALAGLMQLSSGRVSVTPVQNPATANVMATVDVALNMADGEKPPIDPSLPAGPPSRPPGFSLRPAPNPVPADLAASVGAGVDAEHAEVSGSAPDQAKPLALSQKGISPLTAAVLVTLAIVQGVILVLVWRSLGDRPGPAPDAPVAAAKAEAPAKPKAKHEPEPKPAPAKASAAAPAARSAEDAATEFPRLDGSGANAPTCPDLWAQNPPREGSYPGAAYAQARQANKWITRGDVDKAQHAYCLAVRWDKDNVGFMVGLAHLYLLRRDGEQAIPLLKRALELKPEGARARALLGDAYARTGESSAAREQWLRSAAYEPGDREALKTLTARELRRGRHHLERRELVYAETMYRRAAVMDPKNVKAATGLSRALTLLDDAKPARRWAKYAVSLDARDPDARIALGDALHKLGDTEAARVEYKEAQLLDPAHPEANQRMRGVLSEQ